MVVPPIPMLTLDLTQSQPEVSIPQLSLESTLQDLPLQDFQLESDQLGAEVARIFEENPLLSGVILLRKGNFFGLISRRRFLEYMSRPYGLELFSKRSLRVLHEFTRTSPLILSGETTIVQAAQEALQRPSDRLYDPLVVELEPSTYRLLDVHQLLIAQSKIHELTTQLLHEQSQARMIQTEKMASLGQMVAGVAHEILNPVNFICGNVNYLSDYGRDLMQLVSAYEEEYPQPSPNIEAVKEDIDFDFLAKDFPQAIASIKMGGERLKKIINALRNFSHMDEVNRRPIDLHECLDNTLIILTNRTKHGVEIVRNYGNLPPVNCYSGQLSQVFMNLISNAIDALAEKIDQLQSKSYVPTIEITTEICTRTLSGHPSNRWVSIRIADNGPGIPPEIQSRIFETFFTTKPVGKGTGLGLAISHQIVVEKHQGLLNLKSDPRAGTEFEVLIPLED